MCDANLTCQPSFPLKLSSSHFLSLKQNQSMLALWREKPGEGEGGMVELRPPSLLPQPTSLRTHRPFRASNLSSISQDRFLSLSLFHKVKSRRGRKEVTISADVLSDPPPPLLYKILSNNINSTKVRILASCA